MQKNFLFYRLPAAANQSLVDFKRLREAGLFDTIKFRIKGIKVLAVQAFL